jgi:hypothetical protein
MLYALLSESSLMLDMLDVRIFQKPSDTPERVIMIQHHRRDEAR